LLQERGRVHLSIAQPEVVAAQDDFTTACAAKFVYDLGYAPPGVALLG
jgi:hypothetical protein